MPILPRQLLICGACLFGFCLLSCVILGVMKPAAKQAPPSKQERPQRNRITKEKYNSISEGMSYERVVEILGSEGNERSSSQFSEAGVQIKTYTWTNWGGSNITAMFENERLISKAQFGLR